MQDNTPYDPDMTVHEAIELGLVVVIDTQVIGSTYDEQCGYSGPFDDRHTHTDPVCTRAKGHPGVHAYMIRWQVSHDDAVRERARRESEAAIQARVRADAMKELGVKLGESQQAMMDAMTTAIIPAEKALAALDRDLHKLDSMSYGMQTKKKQRFRDTHVGKVRGK